jgi:crotonobetainyl-CoA:carnitine CoA-transferase CaiB-like acyl-CoA transferase
MGQSSFEVGPVDSIYPHVLYSQAIWGATTAVAALIERERSGAGQTVTVGGLHGMLQAMTGSTHIPGAVLEHRPGGPGGTVPFYRTYQGSDGDWLFLASLTPAFFFRVFEALELTHVLADERLNGEPLSMALPENAPWVIEILRETFKQRARDAWRTTLTEIGCPSGPVDDRDDWLDHPQVRAIGMRAELEDPERGHIVMPGLPLQMGATPASIRMPAPRLGQNNADPSAWPAQAGAPASPPRSAGPLTGVGTVTGAGTVRSIRVLDLGAIIAGTYSGSLLAELGADVIKVEPLSGDNLRQFAPTFPGFNKGKRGIAIDLRTEAGHAVFLDLVRDADIVIDNYRQGVLERLKIDYASLRAVNPDIVSISLTGFGEGGTMDGDPGFDPVLQAHSGMMRAQGGDSEPVFFTLPVNDVSSAALLPPNSADDDAALESALTAALAAMNADDAVATLAAHDLAAIRARTIYELPNDPLFEGAEAMHLIVPDFHPPGGAEPFYTMGRYARFSRTERADVLTAPGLGEHTLEVLAEIGRDDAASADLLASGVVAAGDPFVMPPVV